MTTSNRRRAHGRVVLRIFGATVLAALCLVATGVAQTTRHARRSYTARIAQAQTASRHLKGAAARQTYFHAAVQSNPTPQHNAGDPDLADQQDAYNFERLAPGNVVSGEALVQGQQQANGLRQFGGPWQEVTNQPYNANPSDYTDPFWSNVGSGFANVGGRVTALTSTGNTWLAGTADGGVWGTRDQGAHWYPLTDQLPSTSIGALAVDPADGSIWAGTGEANTNQDSYAGIGVYRYANGQIGRVGDANGGNPISGKTVYQLTFDPQGDAYAATNNGLYRMAANSNVWNEVLAPDGPNDPNSSTYNPYNNHITSVAVVPGSKGQDVIAVEGWRGPVSGQKNGFYESKNGGQTFNPVTPTGDIDATDIGRTTFAYSADGSELYAVVESPAKLTAGDGTVLQGVFRADGTSSTPASVAGPWTKIADADKLIASGSAQNHDPTYEPGVQAWYNQTLAVDPADAKHVYLGLEEVYQTRDGGSTWNTAAPYWNYTLPCEKDNSCPNTTHPDQHALAITGGTLLSGNDGGVYTRPLSDAAQYGGWTDTNDTLHDLQYYDARAGNQPGIGMIAYGGLQDNGSSTLSPLSAPQMKSPAGGDGTTVIVDPNHANRWVGSYVDGAMYSSTDGGHTFYDFVSPGCDGQATVGMVPRADCDPNIRFVTPMTQDQQNANTWLVGGQYVWVSKAGWSTSCSSGTAAVAGTTVPPAGCSWQNVFDTGDGNAVTALSSAQNGNIIYAAWVGGGGNPGPSFSRGIATNYGGTWHQLDMSSLPNRYIAGVTVDPQHPSHAYVVFNGYSRRWIPGGGTGHVFETYNGGQSWTDISGNLPDVPGDALLIQNHRLALATDLNMYTAQVGQGANTQWSRLGYGLPNASVNNVTPGPAGYIYAATHGRGIWRLRFDNGGRWNGHRHH